MQYSAPTLKVWGKVLTDMIASLLKLAIEVVECMVEGWIVDVDLERVDANNWT